MYKKLLTVIGISSFLILSGCGREESLLWKATNTPEQQLAHYKDKCLSYGFRSGTTELATCIAEEKRAAVSNAQAAFQQGMAALNQMQQQEQARLDRIRDSQPTYQRTNIYNNRGQYIGYGESWD